MTDKKYMRYYFDAHGRYLGKNAFFVGMNVKRVIGAVNFKDCQSTMTQDIDGNELFEFDLVKAMLPNNICARYQWIEKIGEDWLLMPSKTPLKGVEVEKLGNMNEQEKQAA